MNPQLIRRIDYWIGVPLCALLTVCRWLLPERHAPGRRVVFLKFIEQGATVLAQDAVRRAAAWVGRENVYFCIFESNRAILDVLDIIDPANVIVIRDRGLVRSLLDFITALLTLRRRGVDVTLDLEFFSRASAAFAFLSGATTRVGLHRFTSELPYRGDLMTHRVIYNPYLHVATQYSLMVDTAGYPPAAEPMLKSVPPPTVAAQPVFTPSGRERDAMRARVGAWLADLGRPADAAVRLVLLNPNASDLLPLRKWPTDRFVAVARRVIDDHADALVVLTGAPAEQASADAVCAQIASPRARSFAGRTTLRELLTLYTMSEVLVTNDSGPAHFASLTPISVVTLFGPETPRLFGSLSPKARFLWKGLACSPCVNVMNHRFSPCHDNVCMQSISIDEVCAELTACLQQADASAPAFR